MSTIIKINIKLLIAAAKTNTNVAHDSEKILQKFVSTTVKKNNTKLVSVVAEISNTLWNMNHMVPVDHVGLFHYCSSSDSADTAE